MEVTTRFAPSPTGKLHIGGARTALFNYLLARHYGGKFLLRIEDTDKERSTKFFADSIISSLRWLNFCWDRDIVFQSNLVDRHRQVAQDLVSKRKAYYCFHSSDELKAIKKEEVEVKSFSCSSPHRFICCCGRGQALNRDQVVTKKMAVRLRISSEETTTFMDEVFGSVTVNNNYLEDVVLLRSDGSPTYALSVVVDDHDMEISHVLRGSDHLTNTFLQLQIYKAMEWQPPIFAHLPLINDKDGRKLSKRQRSWDIEYFFDNGFLPEALFNYILRMGWSHGNNEIISRPQAIEWFTTNRIKRSPARFDLNKLYNINSHYLRMADNLRLAELIKIKLQQPLNKNKLQLIVRGVNGLKFRSRTVNDLSEQIYIYTADRPIHLQKQALSIIRNTSKETIVFIVYVLEFIDVWSETILEKIVGNLQSNKGNGIKYHARLLRATITGSIVSPNIFEVMTILGKRESLGRISDAILLSS